VAFHLTVSKGAGAGEAFSFSDEARLGRTADNDVVVKDQAASRSHARVFNNNGKYFVEDLGSANGTRLNNAPIKQAKPLKNGDAITIGDTVFVFELQLDETIAPSSTMDEGGEDDPAATRPPTRSKAAPARPDSTNSDEDEAPSDTGDESGSTGEENVNSTMFVEVPKPKALQQQRGARPSRALPPERPSRGAAMERQPRGRAIEPAPEADAEEVELTAAERARLRRQLQQSAGGRVQLLWQDLPKPLRILVSGFGGLLLVGTVILAAYVAWPRNKVIKPEPKELAADGTLIEDSFGNGNEVSVNLNGQDLSMVPPDDIDPESREIEIVLPATNIKAREDNLIVFDNTRNPPGDEEWRIWNIWVEIIPVPDMSTEEARRRAQGEIEKAAKAYELREVGAANLFRSWKTYREAWLLLEATPDAPPDLLTLSRTRMKEIRPELDKKCNALILKFKGIVNTRPDAYSEGRQVLENIPEHFPTREHPCFNFSRSLLRTMDGFDDFESSGAPPTE
jgi:pSer/pThr/pTyr-binding forkhead associated (FHA) protein